MVANYQKINEGDGGLAKGKTCGTGAAGRLKGYWAVSWSCCRRELEARELWLRWKK